MNDLDALRTDLIERWKAAFARIQEVMDQPKDVAATVYSVYPAFALENYAPAKFKPAARVSRARSGPDDYVFQLDASGRPVLVEYAHTANQVAWRGIYRYTPNEVEHLEVCLQTGVPNLYNRLTLENGVVTEEQRFVCNSGGTHVASENHSPSARAQQILDDPHGHFLYITRYAIAGGVPVTASELHQVGGETHRPSRTYTYAADGKLERIVQHWPGHGARTLFAAKTKTTTKTLVDDLSKRIAAGILERLASLPATPRLAALELNYREHDSPVPTLIPMTEADVVDSLALSAGIPSARWLHLAEEDFAPALADLMARAEASGGTLVAKMLRLAAKAVTLHARATLPVVESFVAFAVDWEIEGDQLAAILKQCGADPATMRAWKKRGWL